MTKNTSELDKQLTALDKKFKSLDIKFSGLWNKLENRLEKSIRDIDGLDNELGRILADLSGTLVKSGLSELVKGGQLDDLLSPMVGVTNDLFGLIPTDASKHTKKPSGDGFGMSSSQILSDLSSALSKLDRNF